MHGLWPRQFQETREERSAREENARQAAERRRLEAKERVRRKAEEEARSEAEERARREAEEKAVAEVGCRTLLSSFLSVRRPHEPQPMLRDHPQGSTHPTFLNLFHPAFPLHLPHQCVQVH